MVADNNVFEYIRNICQQSFMQPRIAENLMRKNISTISKFQNKLWTKNILQRLCKNNLALNDVHIYAENQQKKSKNKQTYSNIVKENMTRKLSDAIKEFNKAKYDMVQSKIELKTVVKPNSVVGREYDDIVNNDWNKSWRINCKKCDDKIKSLQEKQKHIKNIVLKEKHTLVTKKI